MRSPRVVWLVGVAVVALTALAPTMLWRANDPQVAAPANPGVQHITVINLENKGYDKIWARGSDAFDQAVGEGCVYPARVRTVAGQLSDAGRTWKGYAEDMGEGCRHPRLGARDETRRARPGDQYAVRHNPFV